MRSIRLLIALIVFLPAAGKAFEMSGEDRPGAWHTTYVGQGYKLDFDLESAKILPNGLLIYTWRATDLRPITRSTKYMYFVGALDCKTQEGVNLGTMTRKKIDLTPKPYGKEPLVAAHYRFFCLGGRTSPHTTAP